MDGLTKTFPTPRHAVDYIMETFPIVKRKDIATYGFYRTKESILEIYDALADAIRTGRSRPDIIGQNTAGDWVKFESNGPISPAPPLTKIRQKNNRKGSLV